MKNVHLHMDEGVVLEIAHLRGEMVSRKAGQPPVFDDPNSYVMKVFDADIAMDMTSLGNLLNRHVFASENAPLRDISVTTDGKVLEQKGKLRKAGASVPFTMKASVSVTDDGRLRLHSESVSALGVPAKKLMEVFGLSLDDVVKIKEQRGIEVEGDDILISPGQALPPPQIQGTATHVDLNGGKLHQVLGTAGRGASPRLAPTDTAAKNYLYFSGSDIRFGKLLMSNADLMIIDADEKDPFDFFPGQYKAQLVAGYSKNTPQGGLRAYMPDYDDLEAMPNLLPRKR
jgi:hypothetical protein